MSENLFTTPEFFVLRLIKSPELHLLSTSIGALLSDPTKLNYQTLVVPGKKGEIIKYV
jgi:hypothetical protein